MQDTLLGLYIHYVSEQITGSNEKMVKALPGASESQRASVALPDSEGPASRAFSSESGCLSGSEVRATSQPGRGLWQAATACYFCSILILPNSKPVETSQS